MLYAPTWQDYEKSSSFMDAIEPLIETLPTNHNLIVKLHPNLLLQEELKMDRILQKYEDLKNVLFLTEFPAIYPLLNLSDVYIGDMSSIGYDFLEFNRPMFFLNQHSRNPQVDHGLYLFRCGMEIHPDQYSDIHGVIDRYFQFELRDFSSIRNEVKTYAFGHCKPLDELKNEIRHLYALFPDNELQFY